MPTRNGRAVVQRIEFGRGPAAGDERTDQPDRRVRIRRPGVDVGVVHHRCGRNLTLRERHVPRHGAAHAAQRLWRPPFLEELGNPLHVLRRDQAIGP
jgi:hypothetical protein